jgi:hypothetical protein
MTLIRELIDIPTEVADGDFVLKLTQGVDPTQAAQTVRDYEVTAQLADAFDEALALVGSAVESGQSKATFLDSSFGGGKSHFMAILFLLLQGNADARGVAELAPVLAARGPKLEGKRFLSVPVHFLGAQSMEQKILGGYVDRVQTLHPEAALPAVFLDDRIVTEELPSLRARLGDDPFVSGLNEGAADDDWGEFGGTWSVDRVDDALARPATDSLRRELVAAYIAAYRPATVTEAGASGRGYVDLDTGLAEISAHAKGLGYDAVVLFLDELILWLASNIGDLAMVQRESQKLTLLVESTHAHRPAPVVSFVARQRDLRELVGEHIAGEQQQAFADTLELQSGRFSRVHLETRNLPVVAKRRLLRPVSDPAETALRSAVDTALGGRDDVRATLLGSDADVELFRTVYPFSPALVHTLVDVAEALQRERTALKVMLQLLVDQRDSLELGRIIPVGDLWDVVAARDEPFAAELKALFVRAKDLYRTRLRPLLLADAGIDDTTPADDPRWTRFRNDDRLAKTLLLAALVPEVEAFRNLDARRLAALNWGTIASPVPGKETQQVADRVRRWATQIGEIKVGDDPVNPTVSVALSGVDTEEIIERAAGAFDSRGARRMKLRSLVDAATSRVLGDGIEGNYKHEWRGTERLVDVFFGNVRDPAEMADAVFRASPGRPRVVIDFPFDDDGRGPEQDLERLDDWTIRHEPTLTVCWLPSFFNTEGIKALRRYVACDEVLKGDRFETHTAHLSANHRASARPAIESIRDQLRAQLNEAILVAYGVKGGGHTYVDSAASLTDHYRCLQPSLVVRPTTQPTMGAALGELCDQLYDHLYPGHPRFEAKVTNADLRKVWSELQRALADDTGRIITEPANRSAMRNVASGLRLGDMGDAPFLLSGFWQSQLDRHLQAARHEGRRMRVADVRIAIDEVDGGPRGLLPTHADLIVATVAAQSTHSLVHAGTAVTYEAGRPLDGSVELVPETLPADDRWAVAVERASAVFGLNAGNRVSGPEVRLLADALVAKAREWRTAAKELVAELERRYSDLGVLDGDRLATARAGRDLVDALAGADGARAIEVLADAEVPTTAQALGTSLTSAAAVVRSMRGANWDLLRNASDDVRADLSDALERDQFVRIWMDAEADLERRATAELVSRTQTRAPQGPTAGEALPPSGRRRLASAAEASVLLAQIRDAVEGGTTVEIEWRTEAAGG